MSTDHTDGPDDVGDLRGLRALLGIAQVDLAERLGVQQPALSKLERRADLTLVMLRKVVEAMGGSLEIVARLPGRDPVRMGRLERGE